MILPCPITGGVIGSHLSATMLRERLFYPAVKRYGGLTTEIRDSGLVDSLLCGYRGEAFFDQQLIRLGFQTFARRGAGRRSRSGVNEWSREEAQ
jgi:hypothetical protein